MCSCSLWDVIYFCFASVLCLHPVKVVQLQLPVLLQSIQSVIAEGKFSINAKMLKAIIPNMFLDTHESVLTSWEKCNCWPSLEIAFKKWGCFGCQALEELFSFQIASQEVIVLAIVLLLQEMLILSYFFLFFPCFLTVLSFCHIFVLSPSWFYFCMHWSRNCMHAWFGALLPFCLVVTPTFFFLVGTKKYTH